MERGGLEASSLLKVCLFPHLTQKVPDVDLKPAVLEMSLRKLRSASDRGLSCYPHSSPCCRGSRIPEKFCGPRIHV